MHDGHRCGTAGLQQLRRCHLVAEVEALDAIAEAVARDVVHAHLMAAVHRASVPGGTVFGDLLAQRRTAGLATRFDAFAARARFASLTDLQTGGHFGAGPDHASASGRDLLTQRALAITAPGRASIRWARGCTGVWAFLLGWIFFRLGGRRLAGRAAAARARTLRPSSAHAARAAASFSSNATCPRARAGRAAASFFTGAGRATASLRLG